LLELNTKNNNIPMNIQMNSVEQFMEFILHLCTFKTPI